MSRKEDTQYVSGLIRMASYNLGPSYMDTVCMDVDNYINEFAKDYEISSEKIQLEEMNTTLEELFSSVLNIDEKAVKNLVYWITKKCGSCKKIYTSENEELFNSLDGEKGLSPFFFLEEIYFAEFEDTVICFMIGNNE